MQNVEKIVRNSLTHFSIKNSFSVLPNPTFRDSQIYSLNTNQAHWMPWYWDKNLINDSGLFCAHFYYKMAW